MGSTMSGNLALIVQGAHRLTAAAIVLGISVLGITVLWLLNRMLACTTASFLDIAFLSNILLLLKYSIAETDSGIVSHAYPKVRLDLTTVHRERACVVEKAVLLTPVLWTQ